MEKVELKFSRHEKIIIELLQSHKNDSNDIYVIIDKQNAHYQLLMAGWDSKNTYFCRILIHFHLRSDATICLFENHTEIEISDVLLENGVAKSDIFVNFLPKSAREYAGYALS